VNSQAVVDIYEEGFQLERVKVNVSNKAVIKTDFHVGDDHKINADAKFHATNFRNNLQNFV
jgi:hypothetical protein